MKTFILTLALAFGSFLMSTAQTNPNHVYVDGYYKTNGTYVQPYVRTAPNNTINDNFSTYPNVNPYNGNVGTIEPEYNYNNSSSTSWPNSNTTNYNDTWPNSTYNDEW
tara:strand:+ start:44 stop:367 length:324 start_codon:yes stop_codon:yes gene_type:complete